MEAQPRDIIPVSIEKELKQSYLDYAMSVIVGRALPDVRDGLKPVHRRVLFAMDQLSNHYNKPYKKSARIVGDVIGKYHPHGDTAVYDALVRLAQDFSMRYMLADGQGNFGSIDGDNAAAMRYTEVRMNKIAHEMLSDLEKETVDMVPNYDGSEQMPSVLPTKFPALLANGSSGIAVGMATNIPPHNLTEVVNATLALIDEPTLSIDDLMEHIQGPDFPTAGIISGRTGILQAYRTGRGRIYVQAKTHVEEEKSGRNHLIVTELPYQVNKARLIEKIAELVKDKKIEGISELRDESDREGMRVVITLKRGESPEVLLNNLYKQTQLETVFGINIVALVEGQPKVLNLKEILQCFVQHRQEVVTRRTVFLLRKARERGHLLEGHAVALANIDPVIALIKASKTTAEAKAALIAQGWAPGHVQEMLERAGDDNICKPLHLSKHYGMRDGQYYLSEEQAQAILDLRLQKLTGLEIEKLLAEYQDKLDEIRELGLILADPERLKQVIKDEMTELLEEFGDERKTEIEESRRDLQNEDLITVEQVILTISKTGYAKTQPVSEYRAQRRGGRGKAAASMKEDDYVQHLLSVSTHDVILCFTNKGRVFWMRGFDVPQASRGARGKPLVNILSLEEGENVTAILPTPKDGQGEGFICMATEFGVIKKVSIEQFSRPRTSGLRAIELDEGDALVGVKITSGQDQLMLFASNGKAIRFSEDAIRAMGRTARGVRGIRLGSDARVISLLLVTEETTLLTASEKGFGKRTKAGDFNLQGRGGQGVIAMVVNERNGKLIGAVEASDTDEAMLITDAGTLVRTRVDEISVLSRNTQGVTLIKISEGEKLVGLERIEESDDEDEMLDAEGEALETTEQSSVSTDTASDTLSDEDSSSDTDLDTDTDTDSDTASDEG